MAVAIQTSRPSPYVKIPCSRRMADRNAHVKKKYIYIDVNKYVGSVRFPGDKYGWEGNAPTYI